MDRRSITSRENGKKGGRKKGLATLEREKAKDYIATRIGEYMPQIFEVLLGKALEGDIQAIKELFDRGFGKPAQSVDLLNTDGSLKTIIIQKDVRAATNTTAE